MFYVLSKTIFYILMPFTWVVVLLIYALFTSKPLRKRNALIASLLLLFIFNNSFLANKAMLWWEPAPIPYA
ncbi:MAG TPA: hypothetical protein VL947_11075, partial [Cytophagales bacterium]|nr:hypothetical protein [Cytophagales bacterium]